jgi:hypothetical protein
VFGPEITWMHEPVRPRENNLPDPADKPWCEYDMTYRPDRDKFRM